MTIDTSNNNRSYLAAFGSHEGGHNYGLQHASSLEYGNQPLGDLDDGSGVHCEYGDVFSTMGVLYGSNPITGHYSAQHKVQLGWLAPGSGYQEVDSPGAFLLQPAETASGLRGLRILRDLGSNLWLWLEYRQALGGYDPSVFSFSNSAFSGALVHYQYSGVSGGPVANDGRTRLLDFQPGFPMSGSDNQCVGPIGSPDMEEVTLLEGVLWTDPDPNSDLSLLVNSADSNGLSVTVSYGGVLPNQPPTADSVTPSSGSGPGTTFSYTASDPNGYQDLSFVQMMINDTLTSANSCLVWYAPVNNRMYLRSDDGASWLGPLLVGSPGTLQNSRCEVDAGNSSVVSGGTTLTVHLAVQLALNGVKNNWLWATDLPGQNSGWVQVGTWTVTGGLNFAPAADSVTPSSGSGPGTTFSYTASDPNGYQDLSFVQMMINDTLTSANSCLVWYAPGNNRMYLRSDDSASWLGPLLVGSPGTLQNSRCEVDVGNSSVVSGGTTLTVHLAVQLTLNGVKNNWLWATDLGGQHSGWVQVGTWTVTGGLNFAPTADAVTPSSGSGPGTTFSYSVSDPNGYQDLSFVQVMVNDTLTSANSCLVWYAPGNNRMYLRSDDGASWLGPLLVGSAGTLQNSRCEVDVGNSSVVSGGTTLTVHLAVQMTLNGVKNNWLWATDLASQHSGWVLLGTWTVGP